MTKPIIKRNVINRPPAHLIEAAVRAALAEDLGTAGDITTDATVGANATTTAKITSRSAGVISGLPLAKAAFEALDPHVSFEPALSDSDDVEKNKTVAHITGNTRAILSAERVALNFMGHLSGIATLTKRYVDAVAGTGARILDTRKTTPGLRALEKYAVTCGGGHNHRTGLFDAILIKDNHIAAAGGVPEAIRAAKAKCGHMVRIEVEIDTLEQLGEALKHKIDAVLLDNMDPKELMTAVKTVAGRILVEASGGVDLKTVRKIAETGVDLISVGALTHSAPVLDLGLDFNE